MIVHPTTAQLLAELRRELATTIAPELTSETAAVALDQIDIVLAQCALRADHEVAWMVEELAEMDDYVARVGEATNDPATTEALSSARQRAHGSLRATELADDYTLMSEALSCAIEACLADPAHRELLDEGVAILTSRRAERERVLMANWRLVGRG